MGIILALLIASGHAASDATTPLWVILAAHTAIGLGARRWMAHREDDGLEDHQAAARGGRGRGVGRRRRALHHLGLGHGCRRPHHHGHHRGRRRRPAAIGNALGRRRRVVWAWILTIPGAFAIAYLTYLVVDVLS